MTMLNIKSFRLFGSFICPRCSTPCYSTCCGTTTTTAYGPELVDSKRPRKRKKQSKKEEEIHATMADSGVKQDNMSIGKPSMEQTDGSSPDQETNVGWSDVKETEEISYRAGLNLENAISVESPAADLAHFLSRPVLIHRQTWPAGGYNPFSLFAWQEYLSDARVREKLSLFKLLRATLKVKIVINATPFHYGLSFVGVRPMINTNNTSNILPSSTGSIINFTKSGSTKSWQGGRTFFSQRPHVFINPRTQSESTITWPFFAMAPFIDLVNDTNPGRDLGCLEVWIINQLEMSNAGTDPVQFSMFAWLEDVKLVGIDVFATATAGDEYAGNGVVSGPATAIARFAARFSGDSFIGRLARATEIGSSAVGSIASLFGFSDPPIIDKQTIITQIQGGKMPNTTGYEPLVKLSLDPKQELSIDPGLVDLPARDELSFDYIWKREALLVSDFWLTSSTGHLFGCSVHPGLGAILDAAFFTDLNANCKAVTPMNGVAQLFKYWRGSLVFRIQVVCSQMHRGRLLLTYTPTAESVVPGSPDLNSYYSHVIDISEQADVSFEVKWTQKTMWREVRHINTTDSDKEVCLGTDRHLEIPDRFCNGRIDLWVQNSLTAPDASATVPFNIWVRAGDDFDVMSPDDDWNLLSYSNDGGLYPIPEATSGDIVATMADSGYVKQDCDDTPNHECAMILNDNFSSVNTQVLFNTYGGEQIRSVRTLMKRWVPYNTYVAEFDGTNNVQSYSIFQPNFPIGRALLPYGSSGTDQSTTSSIVFQTHIRWFCQAYVATKGGVRHMFSSLSSTGRPMYHAFRIPDAYTRNINETTNEIVGTPINSRLFLMGANPNMSIEQGCSAIQTFMSRDSDLFLYEMPYYAPVRCSLIHQDAQAGSLTIEAQEMYAAHKVLVEEPTSPSGDTGNIVLRQYISAGEDLQFHFFYGFPLVYVQPLPDAP